MNQQLYASLSTPIKQQILAKRFETYLRENLSGYKPDVNNKQIFTMMYSKAEVLNCRDYYNEVEESAYSSEDAKPIELYMSKICSHDVSLVSTEEWDDHIHPIIALNLVETYEVPENLNTEKIYILVIEFAPVFPQFKLTASFFENFKNLASLSLCEYSFNDDVDGMSMFSELTLLQFLFLKYCNIGSHLQEILDICSNLETMRLIHCNFSCKKPIKLPELMKVFYILRYEPFGLNISRCENNLEQLTLDTKIYHVKIITSESSNTKISTPQSSNTKIITSQSSNFRTLDLRCYLIDPRCFGKSLKFINNLTLDWDAIYNYATIGSSTTKNLQDTSRHVALECIIWLKTFRVIRPSREYNLTCAFSGTVYKEVHDDIAVKAILEWEDGIIQCISCPRYPMHLMETPPHELVVRRS